MHSDLDSAFSRTLREELHALPGESAPPFGWTELRRRARAHGRLRPAAAQVRGASARRLGAWASSRPALAAALAVLIVSIALCAHWLLGTDSPGRTAGGTPAPRPSHGSNPQLEASQRWLASLPDDHAIVRVGSRVPVMDLEDRIALTDDALNVARLGNAHPARVQALQRERAQLLQSLVQVRYAESLASDAP
jgi:hypothetical protein